MYEGSNPIALQSKQWIVEALLKLLQSKRYKDIQIKEICAEADLSRQTFYNLFKEKDDVLRLYLKELRKKEIVPRLDKNGVRFADFVRAFTDFSETHRDFLELLAANNTEYLLTETIARGIEGWADKFDPESDALHSYGAAFLSGGLTHLIIHWAKQEDGVSKEELNSLLERVFRGEFYVLADKEKTN